MSVTASASASPTSGTAPLTVQFTDASTTTNLIIESGSETDTYTESGARSDTITEGT